MGGSLRSGMDHVPGTGPHRVGMVTPSVESLHNPTQFGFDSTLDAVSRHCEKKLRCQIQSCLDVIKHIYIYICFFWYFMYWVVGGPGKAIHFYHKVTYIVPCPWHQIRFGGIGWIHQAID